jgi:signal transduction histidine kinase/CheY-like chemotaxis protein
VATSRASQCAFGCGLVAVSASCLVLVGWALDIVWLKSIVPGFVAMNPATAICFMLGGLSLVLLRANVPSKSHGRLAKAAALVMAIVGCLRLTADLFYLEIHVDQLLFAGTLGENRMAPNTALCFIFSGLSLLVLDLVPRRAVWPAQIFALMVVTISLVSLVGYAYGAESLYHIAYIPMAVHTAAVFQILSIGILLARPERGVVAVLLHDGPGGVMTRRLLPAVVAIPCALGWLRLAGQHRGYYETEFGAAIMVAVTIMLFSVAMIWIAAALNRSDLDRHQAELATRQLNDELEQRVKDRTDELANRDAQLRQAQKMEAIGTLAGGVAHEFNNLLQAIQGYTRYAMDGLDAESDSFKDLQQVLGASDRAATLTRQLLGFSRRELLQMADIDPNSLVRGLVKMLRPLIGEQIKIELLLGENVGSIHADVGHVEQMLMNLCVNARDAMPHGGQLSIKTEDLTLLDAYCDYHGDIQPGRYAMLAVADTGCGMPADVKAHVFEPFFTTKEVGKGTGLGLAMVYGVVQQHHGAIRVYSEPGIGTTFRIYLPTVDHASTAATTVSCKLTRGGTETILVAEDEPLVRELTERMLRRAGYHTIVATNGEEAVQLFEENMGCVSLALLDVVMPKMGGREAFQRIKAIKPAMRVVFCSGYDPEMTEVGFVLDEQFRLVQKPFDPDSLLATIRETLDEEICVLT